MNGVGWRLCETPNCGTWSASSLISVYPYRGSFDTIELLSCNLRNLNGFNSMDIGAIHTVKT